MTSTQRAFDLAKERYSAIGVDVDKAMETMASVKVSLHCWQLRRWELDGDFTRRLAILEELRTMPFGPIWDKYCEMNNVPVSTAWIEEVMKYEQDVLMKR